MHRYHAALLSAAATAIAGALHAQTYIQAAPSSSQSITQPSGTAFSIDGKVGIGTSSPDVPLVVSGNNPSVELFNTNNSPNEKGYFSLFPGLFQFSFNRDVVGAIINSNEGAAYVNVGGGGSDLAKPSDFSVVLQSAPDVSTSARTFTNVLRVTGDQIVRFSGNAHIGTSATLDTPVGFPLVIERDDSTIELVNGATSQKSFLGTVSGLVQWAFNRVPASGLHPDSNLSSGFVNLGPNDTSGPALFDVVLASAHDTEPMNILRVSGAGEVTMAANLSLTATGAGLSFPNYSGKQTTPWMGTLGGQDYADSVEVSGDRAAYDPGDVMVIDPASPRHFLRSSQPYSSLAAGVYSTKPGVVGTRRKDLSVDAAEVPLAMVGIVPTNVTAQNGPIHIGDLLVTSSTPGFAMKGTDRAQMLGAVIGKALGNLEAGTGKIDVLISLQ